MGKALEDDFRLTKQMEIYFSIIKETDSDMVTRGFSDFSNLDS